MKRLSVKRQNSKTSGVCNTKYNRKEVEVNKIFESIAKKGVMSMQVQETNGKVAAHCLREIRRIFQENLKENPKTEAEIRMNLGIKRYEK